MLYPIANKIVLKTVEQTGTTTGGVILPDIEQEGTLLGIVIAAGPGLLLSSGKRGPMQCKAGDTVVFPKHGAKKFEVEDEEHFIIPEHDILTIIDED